MKKKEEDNLLNVLDLLPVGVAIIEKDLRVARTNSLFEKYFGEINGQDLTKLTDILFAREALPGIREIFETGAEQVAFRTYSYSGGKQSQFAIQLMPLGSTDSVGYVVAIANDVSAAQHWQKEFNLLFEKVPCYISIVDKNFAIVRANEKYRETFGDGPLYNIDFKKKTPDTMYLPSAMTFSDGKEHTSTIIGTTKSGEKAHFIVSSTPIAYADNQVTLVMEIANDITEINQLQEQLHHAHDFYADIIESSADGIIAITNKGKTQIFNNSAKKILNWNQTRKPGIPKIQEMLPKLFFVEPDSDGTIAKDQELNIIASDGEEVPVRFNAFEIRNKKIAMGRVAFLQDLRTFYELENQKSLAEREALATTFLALETNVKKLLNDLNSHLDTFENTLESGNPLTVKNDWSYLRKKFDLSFKIVDTFVILAKGYNPVKKPFNFKSLFLNVVAQFEDLAGNLGIGIDTDVHDCPDEINSDEFAVTSLLKILLSNGLDASMENSKTIPPRIFIKAHCDEGYLFITIHDTGAYTPKEILDKYFTMKDSNETRIGLLTSSLITKRLGGELSANSAKNFGNTFFIKIPAE